MRGGQVRTRAGFSIAEMLVAFAIFVSGILIVLSVFPTSYRAMRQGRIVLLATHHARSGVEELTRKKYTDLQFLIMQQNLILDGSAISVRNSALTIIVNGVQERLEFQTRIWVRTAPNGMVDIYAQEYYRQAQDPPGIWRGTGGNRAPPYGTATPLVQFETLLADKG